ncbi:MAG: glycine cleavage system protein GcvH [Actinobacteria bacterium]|uniref:Unannotated protein n=1 Tax=freshwater metagenome TaxID=449393 RepID=A0A6J7AFN2_9ZZZZ|nr:glycine cleavage system protein GcvH [Actinomycetota bacterium]MSX10790.1 glycine cleavage system protein GcvH [Actinomycetota bacterium]MSX68526.1 glycine cleavage system protein GcvH [Actinomycetota bacterium]
MNIPENLKYTNDHEWAKSEGTRVRIGITDYAQDALGDVVFVDLPAIGSDVVAGGAIGEVESTKSVSEIYAPVSGTIVAINQGVVDSPEHLNGDPYGDGWLFEIETSEAAAFESLLSPEAYRALTDG